MERNKDAGLKAEFLWPPSGSSLSVTSNSSEHNLNIVPVRFTRDGAPVPMGNVFYMTSAELEGGSTRGDIGDENGIACFTPDVPAKLAGKSVNLVIPDAGSATANYAVNVNADSKPLQTIIVWPPADAVLPLDTDIIISAFHIQPNGINPWSSESPQLPLLRWASPQGVVTPLADQPHFPLGGGFNLVRRAKIRIPSTNAPATFSVTVLSDPDPSTVLVPATMTWRVAKSSSVNELYLAPPVNFARLPNDKNLPAVATLLDPQGKPVSGAKVAWKWKDRGPSINVINDVTDDTGKSRATISCPRDFKIETNLSAFTLDAAGYHDTLSHHVAFPGYQKGPGTITFREPSSGDTLSAGQPHRVEANYQMGSLKKTGGTDTSAPWGQVIVWSTDPYRPDITFDPPTSVVDNGFGFVYTTVTSQASSSISDISLVAISANPDGTDGIDKGVLKNISFEVATDNELSIYPPSDDEALPLNYLVSAVAKYVDRNGNPISNAPITWEWKKTSVAGEPEAPMPMEVETDADGEATALIRATKLVTADLRAVVTDPRTSKTYEAWARNLRFDAAIGGPGVIEITSIDGDVLESDREHPLHATYTLIDGTPSDGVKLTWSTQPNGHDITFTPSRISDVVDGQSSVNIKAAAGVNVAGITIVARAPNYYGNDNGYDKGTLQYIAFETTRTLTGLAVEKAMAANPYDGQFNPNNPLTTITAALRLQPLPVPSDAKATLRLSSTAAPVKLCDTSGTELSKDENGDYVAAFNKSGYARFKISAPVFSLFTITPIYKDQTLQPSQILIADVQNAPPGDIDPPLIHNVKPGETLNIPTEDTAFTFTVRMDIEDQEDIGSTTPIVLWLNGQIVYTGQGSDLQKGVPVAYAALNTGDDVNTLYCLYNYTLGQNNLTLNSQPLLFKASGKPAYLPATVGRTLAAPDGLPAQITAWECAQGITLTVDYSGAQPGDAITVFCHLMERNTDVPRRNVIQFDLTRGNGPSTLLVPQIYLAGYAAGSLVQVDYRVNGSRWSNVANAQLSTADIPGVMRLPSSKSRKARSAR